MTGRGTPRKAKCPGEKRANGTSTRRRTVTSPSRCTRTSSAEEIIITSSAEEKQKETFEGQSTKERLPEDYVANDQEKIPENTTENYAKGSCSKDPTPDKNQENIQTTTAQVTPHIDRTANGARPKTRGVKTKSPVENMENINFNKLNGKGVKPCAEQAESEADVAKKAEPSTILYATREKLKIKMKEKSRASAVINKIEKVILEHLASKTICFRQVEEPLHTGSYYENLKISNPDEFDIMFPIPVQRIKMEPFSEDGAFYIVSLKQRYSPLQKFQREEKPLPASEILQEFRSEVIESIRNLPGVKHENKKKGCPAVTLSVEVDSHIISLDIVLCLVVQSSWPAFTEGGLKIESWLGRKVRLHYKFKPYYLVAKYKGKGTDERNGILAKDCWRISFSHVEKDIIKNHGSEKTCCEKDGANCCRKDCLKLLKHLLSLLKEQDKSFDKFCSYHAKTTFLHACCSRNKDSQWAAADLTQCFEQLLEDFEKHLKRRQLSNFFIPSQNLLSECSQKSCSSLALCIQKEREEGFPIFKC